MRAWRRSIGGEREMKEWKLVWSDEFDYEGLPDETKWDYQVGGSGWGNQEAQYYRRACPENVWVHGGLLHIIACREDWEENHYTSTRLISREGAQWTGGRFEIRARLPKGRGTWPAIWMMPRKRGHGPWPDCGEIDIMEHVGYDPDQVHGTIHTGAFNHRKGTQKTAVHVGGNVSETFHTYALEWEEHCLRFFMDDECYLEYIPEEHCGTVTAAEWPFDEDFYLILNIAVGGLWGGAQGIDDSVFPQEMQVEYVRVYQRG